MATASSVDGRTARRLANRDRILDVALDLVAEGAEVSVELISERAGVSVRSVYNHFPTGHDLVVGMYERGTERVRPLLAQAPKPDDPFDERVRAFVRVWGRVQEEIAPIRWRALVAEDTHPGMRPVEEELRRAQRAEVERMFPELSDRNARAAAAAITDSLAWRSLRRHQGLSFDAACDVVEATLRRLID
jgi:AcrR family transcriptional regulator